jgi:tripartite-type tricarboxylate transporter receptor subunit TctC
MGVTFEYAFVRPLWIAGRAALALGTIISPLSDRPSQAEDYPTRPVQIVVPFAAGGGVDVITRIIAAAAGDVLKQSVVIENRGGGATIAGSEGVARAQPDGYTLLAAPTTMVINPALRAKLPFDWERDFVPIALMVKLPFVVTTGRDLSASNMKELAQLGKSGSDPLTFGSGGMGTVAHLAGELFQLQSGAHMQHVPYRGEAPALSDAIAGLISVMFSTLVAASPHIEDGSIKALAVTTRSRASLMPSVPTVAEQGYPDYDISAWVAIVAPKNTPPDVIATLNGAINEALTRPGVRERLVRLGAEPAGGTPSEVAAFMRKEADLWAGVVKAADVMVER